MKWHEEKVEVEDVRKQGAAEEEIEIDAVCLHKEKSRKTAKNRVAVRQNPFNWRMGLCN